MNIKIIDIKEALDVDNLIKNGFKYALIYSLNEVKLCKVQQANIDTDTLIEARIFNDKKEIHIFKSEGKLNSVLQEEVEDDFFTEKQILMDKYGDEIIIKHYVEYDKEDNQAYIAYSRPCDVVIGGKK